MDDGSLYFDVCLFFIIVFALLFFVSLYGISYGLNEDSPGYIWAGGICSFIALSVEGVASYCLYNIKKGQKGKKF